jgi:peroxisomal enoyl-CoA hydratase 2
MTAPLTISSHRLNGDYNPLHATPEPGQELGFGGPIIHGLLSWNESAHALLKELGGSNPSNIQEFRAKFSAPVKPGAKLIVKMWRTGEIQDGFEEIIFVTEVDGETVLSDGRALIKCVPSM